MFSDVLSKLTSGIANIDILINARLERLKAGTTQCGSWKLENNVKNHINNIKVHSDNLSKTCIKVVLLLSTNPSNEVMSSIVPELADQCSLILGTYFSLLELSVSDCLFDYVSKSVRVLLVHTKDLVMAVSINNRESMEMSAGMITKISEDIQKLPLANRLAYRRYIMENCSVIKETVSEFQGYLAEHREGKSSAEVPADSGDAVSSVFSQMTVRCGKDEGETKGRGGGTEEDEYDDEYDEEEEDQEYTGAEAAEVERQVNALQFALDCGKVVLSAISVVSDAIVSAQQADASSGDAGPQLAELDSQAQVWVGALASLTRKLNDLAVDLGAELYPPLDQKAVFVAHNALVKCALVAVDMVSDERFAHLHNEELVATIARLETAIESGSYDS